MDRCWNDANSLVMSIEALVVQYTGMMTCPLILMMSKKGLKHFFRISSFTGTGIRIE